MRNSKKYKMEKIRKITIKDKDYPKTLKQIAAPPKQIYVRGNINIEHLGIGVVGSRLPSSYGKQVTPKLTEELARSGLTIISGLALGIDALAHEAALRVGGKTIAVLGSGIDDKSIYPAVHKNLANRIVESGGALVSEYEAGTKPERYHFPARNRIIVGLSKGVVVIEAKEKSGALITSKLAVENNRDVFAVPGPITSHYSYGPNRLIRAGAKPVLDANDILEEYGMVNQNRSAIKNLNNLSLSAEEKIIVNILKDSSAHIDEIIIRSNINTSSLNGLLIMMEIKGLIKNLGEGIYGL